MIFHSFFLGKHLFTFGLQIHRKCIENYSLHHVQVNDWWAYYRSSHVKHIYSAFFIYSHTGLGLVKHKTVIHFIHSIYIYGNEAIFLSIYSNNRPQCARIEDERKMLNKIFPWPIKRNHRQKSQKNLFFFCFSLHSLQYWCGSSSRVYHLKFIENTFSGQNFGICVC